MLLLLALAGPIAADVVVTDDGRTRVGRVKEVVLLEPAGGELRLEEKDLLAITLDADRDRIDEHWLVATLRFTIERERRGAAKRRSKVGVYVGRGVFPPSAMAVVRRLDESKRAPRCLFASDISKEGLEGIDLLVVPGGWAPSMLKGLTTRGQRALATWVERGGRYMGICAGGYLPCGTVVWEGKAYPYPINLVRGQAVGPLDGLAPWPTADAIALELERGASRATLYAGGAAFDVVDAAIVARYPGGSPAAILAEAGKGRLLLTGAHVEFVGGRDDDLLDWEAWAPGLKLGDAKLFASFLKRLKK